MPGRTMKAHPEITCPSVSNLWYELGYDLCKVCFRTDLLNRRRDLMQQWADYLRSSSLPARSIWATPGHASGAG